MLKYYKYIVPQLAIIAAAGVLHLILSISIVDYLLLLSAYIVSLFKIYDFVGDNTKIVSKFKFFFVFSLIAYSIFLILTDIFDIRKMPIYSEQHFFSSSLAFSFSLGDFLDIIILAFSIILDFYATQIGKITNNPKKFLRLNIFIVAILFVGYVLFVSFILKISDINIDFIDNRSGGINTYIFIFAICLFTSSIVFLIMALMRNILMMRVGILYYIFVFSFIITILFNISDVTQSEREMNLYCDIVKTERDQLFEDECTRCMDFVQYSDIIEKELNDSVFNEIVSQFFGAETMSSYDKECVVGDKDFLSEIIGDRDTVHISKNLINIDDPTPGSYYVGIVALPKNLRLYVKFFREYILSAGEVPALILSSGDAYIPKLNEFSFAIYRDDKLDYKLGNFVFPIDFKRFDIADSGFGESHGSRYLVKNINDRKKMVLMVLKPHFFENIAPFSYICIIILLIIIAIRFLSKESNLKGLFSTIHGKIQMTMIASLGIFLIFIGLISVFFIVDRKKKDIDNEQYMLTKSISENIRKSFSDLTGVFVYNDSIVLKNKDIFFKDINIYDIDGRLVGSSQRKLYHKMGKENINHSVLQRIIDDDIMYLVDNEKLINYDCRTSYMLMTKSDGTALGYLSVIDFETLNERDEAIVYIFSYLNIILIIIALSGFIVVFVSRRTMKPLAVVQEHIQNIDIESNNALIPYSGQDEIGALINGYNKMVVKLDESMKRFAILEREAAWRDMARQVAHEIKNPLTPLKLKTQLIQMSLIDASPKMKEYFNMVLEQVRVLEEIATSFSSYVKLPPNNPETFELSDMIKSVAATYDTEKRIKVVVNTDKTNVFCDRTLLNHVISNIIKNAIQSIEPDKDGLIEIDARVYDETCHISIRDNGCGISKDIRDKIFMPKFTTKSTGQGIGLSVVYDRVKTMGGNIFFESEENKGTTFFVDFPVANEKNL